jgi:hypothetical protein
MTKEIAELYGDLNHKTARFKVPFKTLFLCGGPISALPNEHPKSLRDYLFRVRSLKISGKIIRAEQATQIYRDSGYSNLISFEEDIAKIASLVLVISESPGSLAELGAFSVHREIRPSLIVIMQTSHEKDESFIRYGPIDLLKRLNNDSVGFYPWKTTNSNRFVIKSAKSHVGEMRNFINSRLNKSPESRNLLSDAGKRLFYIIYWILYLSYAASLGVIWNAVKSIFPDIPLSEVRTKLYTLRVMGWIDSESYSNKEYFFALGAEDPVEYKFPAAVKRKDIFERRLAVRRELDQLEKIPKHIRVDVNKRRGGAK